MRSSALAAALLGSLAAGCTVSLVPMGSPQPYYGMPAFVEGRIILSCRYECAGRWIHNRSRLAGLYQAQEWEPLAAEIASIGYPEDLAYFWLGRAAESQGYLPAAATYYTLAYEISQSPNPALHCSAKPGGCFGIRPRQEALRALTSVRATLGSIGQPAPYRPAPTEPYPLLPPPVPDTLAPGITPVSEPVPEPKLPPAPAKEPEDEVLVPPPRP